MTATSSGATTATVSANCRYLAEARQELAERPGVAAALGVQAAKRLLTTAVNEVRSGFRIG